MSRPELPHRSHDHEEWQLRLDHLLSGAVAPSPVAQLRAIVLGGLGKLPPPASGETLWRWRCLSHVASIDLPLVKLFEGHTDALAILAECGTETANHEAAYGMWAAESPDMRVTFRTRTTTEVTLEGTKAWCSGAAGLDRALLTVWSEKGTGPWLADVALDQPGVSFEGHAWKAVGMSSTDTVDVRFERASARLVGGPGFYLSRPGFWQGGIGIAACWHGAASFVADRLRQSLIDSEEPGWHRLLALGDVDRLLSANAALLREAATWVDAHPHEDASDWAYRTRASSDEAAQSVLRAATRAMGAGPLCRDERFARLAADLPVFIRQCHADRDLVALGKISTSSRSLPWKL